MAVFDRQDTHNAVVTIIAQKLKIEPSAIDAQSTMQNLGADSLDMVEIVMKLEEQFGIEIDDEKAEQLNDIQGVVDYIHSLRRK
jgi:acyl carrier protein